MIAGPAQSRVLAYLSTGKYASAGELWLASFGFETSKTMRRQRFAYGCLDWSERRDHLARSLASHLPRHFVARGWLRRGDRGARALSRDAGPPREVAAVAWPGLRQRRKRRADAGRQRTASTRGAKSSACQRPFEP